MTLTTQRAREIGRKGGSTTAARRGRQYMREIGRKGALVTNAKRSPDRANAGAPIDLDGQRPFGWDAHGWAHRSAMRRRLYVTPPLSYAARASALRL